MTKLTRRRPRGICPVCGRSVALYRLFRVDLNGPRCGDIGSHLDPTGDPQGAAMCTGIDEIARVSKVAGR